MLLIPASIVTAVAQASAELEADEYSAAGGPYDRLSSFANGADLTTRIALATQIYLEGCSELRGSRAFDNCFEQNDGEQVVAGLAKEASTNDRLRNAILRDFGGVWPSSWPQPESDGRS